MKTIIIGEPDLQFELERLKLENPDLLIVNINDESIKETTYKSLIASEPILIRNYIEPYTMPDNKSYKRGSNFTPKKKKRKKRC